MFSLVIFDDTRERRENLIVAGKYTCRCGKEHTFYVGKEQRCPKCKTAIVFLPDGLVATGIWEKKLK